MKKIWLFLSLLICSTLLIWCSKQENFSQEVSKESVALLIENDENLISPIINRNAQATENVLSVLSENQIDIALQIISENLAKITENDNERPDWTYQDYYDLALTQNRSIRNVALELFKKDLNELSVDEYLDILDNHLSELYENAITIAPSEKIKNAVWGGNIENQSYTDSFKLDLNPIAIYSWYRWKLEIYSWVDDNYVYEMTYSTPDNPIREWDSSIPPITVSFLSDYLVTKDVINEKQDQWVLEINWLDFLHMLDNHIWIWWPYTSWVIDLNCWRWDSRKCEPSEWNYRCVEFPTWSWTVVLTWDEYVWEKVYYNYINHLSEPISWHPWSYTYANNTYAEAGEYCYIEIWKPSDLEPLPFKFWKWFENVIVTWTKDIKWWTECHDNLDWIAHDYALKIITDKIVCDLWINNEAKILEISIPDDWIE